MSEKATGPAQGHTPVPTTTVWPGQPYPLGATYDGSGTNFALFSEVADRVELCLFDADDQGGTETRIERAERAGNLKASPTRYEIDPADHFRSIRVARAEGLAVIGAYHSHPRTAPEPSPTDLVGASDTALLYVIVSPATSGALGQEVGAFRLVDDRFVRVALVVGDSGRPETTRSIGGEPRPTA